MLMHIRHIYIMTSEHTGIMTEGKKGKDPNGLKIASFRTKEGVWGEFCHKAESMGMTATDVIRAAMAEFIDGSYTPVGIHTVINTVNHHDSVLTHHDVLEIVNTAVSKLSLPNHDAVMTIVNIAIDDRILPLIESHTDLLAELETYTRSQFAAVNELISLSSRELRVPTAKQVDLRSHLVNTESIAVSATTSQEKPDAEREYITFAQLAKQLGYKIPDDVKVASPRTEGAEGLIEFAATLGHSYKWDGRNRKFSKTEVVD